nr:hypothetical protein [Desulfobacula sp.]
MSRSQLMQALQLKDRVNFTRMYLEPALALNLIEMTQPDYLIQSWNMGKERENTNGKTQLQQLCVQGEV